MISSVVSPLFRRLPSSSGNTRSTNSTDIAERRKEEQSSLKDDLSEVDYQESSSYASAPQHEQLEEETMDGVELVLAAPTNLEQGDDAVEAQLLLDALGSGGVSFSSASRRSSLCQQQSQEDSLAGYLRSESTDISLKPARRLPAAETEDTDSMESEEAVQALHTVHASRDNHPQDDNNSLSTVGSLPRMLDSKSSGSQVEAPLSHPADSSQDALDVLQAMMLQCETANSIDMNGEDSWRTTQEEEEALSETQLPPIESEIDMPPSPTAFGNAFQDLRALLFQGESNFCSDMEECEENTMGDDSFVTTCEQPMEQLPPHSNPHQEPVKIISHFETVGHEHAVFRLRQAADLVDSATFATTLMVKPQGNAVSSNEETQDETDDADALGDESWPSTHEQLKVSLASHLPAQEKGETFLPLLQPSNDDIAENSDVEPPKLEQGHMNLETMAVGGGKAPQSAAFDDCPNVICHTLAVGSGHLHFKVNDNEDEVAQSYDSAENLASVQRIVVGVQGDPVAEALKELEMLLEQGCTQTEEGGGKEIDTDTRTGDANQCVQDNGTGKPETAVNSPGFSTCHLSQHPISSEHVPESDLLGVKEEMLALDTTASKTEQVGNTPLDEEAKRRILKAIILEYEAQQEEVKSPPAEPVPTSRGCTDSSEEPGAILAGEVTSPCEVKVDLTGSDRVEDGSQSYEAFMALQAMITKYELQQLIDGDDGVTAGAETSKETSCDGGIAVVDAGKVGDGQQSETLGEQLCEGHLPIEEQPKVFCENHNELQGALSSHMKVGNCKPQERWEDGQDEQKVERVLFNMELRDAAAVCDISLQQSARSIGEYPALREPEVVETPTMSRKGKDQQLVRELKHIQAHGPNVFELLKEKIESWGHHESQLQSDLKLKRVSPSPASSRKDEGEKRSAAPVDGHDVDDELQSWREDPARLRTTTLIRELKYVHTQGGDIVNLIDDKVKSWQKQESQRRLEISKPIEAEKPCLSEVDGSSQDAPIDETKKQRRLSTPTTSGSTKSTRSLTTGGSLLTSSEHYRLLSLDNTAAGPTTTETQHETFDGTHRCMIAPPLVDGSFAKDEWDTAFPVGSTGRRPAIVSPERRDIELDTMTVEITVRSLLTSLADDEDAWTVMESLEEIEAMPEGFAFSDLDVEDEGEVYGIVGHGVSDNVSVMSDLTMATFVSLKGGSNPSPALPLPLEEVRLRKVSTSPGKVPEKQQDLPFQRVKLKKSFTNPSRLPQMRDAALLLLYRHQLKPVGASAGNGSQAERKKAPWKRTLRRSFSDKPAKCDVTPGDLLSEIQKAKEQSSVGSGCILDYDWDELDELTDKETPAKATEVHPSEAMAPLSAATPVNSTPAVPSSKLPQWSRLSGNENEICKTDGFYDSVSISFLTWSIREASRDAVVVHVMEEALRILRCGGVLNVLDIDGFAMDCIQRQPQFVFLTFAEATTKDQERPETNTLSILRKSGLETQIDVNDPHLVHWIASKQGAITIGACLIENPDVHATKEAKKDPLVSQQTAGVLAGASEPVSSLCLGEDGAYGVDRTGCDLQAVIPAPATNKDQVAGCYAKAKQCGATDTNQVPMSNVLHDHVDSGSNQVLDDSLVQEIATESLTQPKPSATVNGAATMDDTQERTALEPIPLPQALETTEESDSDCPDDETGVFIGHICAVGSELAEDSVSEGYNQDVAGSTAADNKTGHGDSEPPTQKARTEQLGDSELAEDLPFDGYNQDVVGSTAAEDKTGYGDFEPSAEEAGTEVEESR